MKIAQITDIHIGPDENPVREVDVRKNFLDILELANTYPHDLVMLTGDLCFMDASPDIYAWIIEQLKEHVQVPYYVIPGNHDDSKTMARSFDINDKLIGDELYYSISHNGYTLVCLDTAIGKMSGSQKSWLAKILSGIQDSQLLVFMHHPPIEGLVPHMDNRYALQDRDEVLEILTKVEKPVHVFCGHYHVDKVIQHHNITVHITPSSFIQIDQRRDDFLVDHLQPGFRMIEMRKSRMYSQVHYVRH